MEYGWEGWSVSAPLWWVSGGISLLSHSLTCGTTMKWVGVITASGVDDACNLDPVLWGAGTVFVYRHRSQWVGFRSAVPGQGGGWPGTSPAGGGGCEEDDGDQEMQNTVSDCRIGWGVPGVRFQSGLDGWMGWDGMEG